MTTNVSLTPALEEFARDCVKNGRYTSVSEVVREALRLLVEREERRKRFNAMLDEVREDAKHSGTRSLEEVTATMDTIIAKSR